MPKHTKLEMTQEWARIVIERWQKRMESLDMGDSGELLKSFESQVSIDANGDPSKITFAFLYYGRFPDMGVGRGVTLSDVPDSTGRRQVKPWYSQTFMNEVMKLGQILAAEYGVDAAMALQSFRQNINVVKNDAAWRNMNR